MKQQGPPEDNGQGKRAAALQANGVGGSRRGDSTHTGSPGSGGINDFSSRNALEHFYCGFEWNPRWRVPTAIFSAFCASEGGRDVCELDGKMWLYLAGAVLLWLHILSAACLHALDWGGAAGGAHINGLPVSNGMLVYLLLFGWFVVEYLYFEDVHTFTYDLFAERLGFKLIWGCLCFYPHFYCIGVWAIVEGGKNPANDLSLTAALAIVLLFFLGWGLTRGANLQKFLHKLKLDEPSPGPPAHKVAELLVGWASSPCETVPGSEGRLLCSGWWALSRHVNYCGEILQAVALALPGWMVSGCSSFTPWLYPLYYVLLFVPRQAEDDEACAVKYGVAWARYCAAVPFKIFPGVY